MMTQMFNMHISRSVPPSSPRYTAIRYLAPFMDCRKNILSPILPSPPSIPCLTLIPLSLLTKSSIAS